MAFPALADPRDIPVDRLFPEAYEASRREVARDFAFFATIIVASVVLAAALNYAISAQMGL